MYPTFILRMSTKILVQYLNGTSLTASSEHFWQNNTFCQVARTRILQILPDTQQVCVAFKGFFFCIFFKLLDYVSVWREICNLCLINDLHNGAYYICGSVVLIMF